MKMGERLMRLRNMRMLLVSREALPGKWAGEIAVCGRVPPEMPESELTECLQRCDSLLAA